MSPSIASRSRAPQTRCSQLPGLAPAASPTRGARTGRRLSAPTQRSSVGRRSCPAPRSAPERPDSRSSNEGTPRSCALRPDPAHAGRPTRSFRCLPRARTPSRLRGASGHARRRPRVPSPRTRSESRRSRESLRVRHSTRPRRSACSRTSGQPNRGAHTRATASDNRRATRTARATCRHRACKLRRHHPCRRGTTARPHSAAFRG
mmetsp:Transcript_35681/g.99767  ORF Transcript_35681/g.99767 Transcript_35681/m.99767 type:complete len:205 (-) Transcript_35681:42-656(-)